MRKSQRSSSSWFSIVRKKVFRSSSCPQETAAIFHTINNTSSTSSSQELIAPREGADKGAIESVVGNNNVALSSSPSQKKELSKEDIAAIKIQASFRAHLARRALRALKSLVKLQAVVRGACVRRQARMALHCMHALSRLQLTVRARRLLS